MSGRLSDYDKVRRDPKTRSVWDKDVDIEKVMRLPPLERHRLFPDDYGPDGRPIGDF